MHLRFFILAVVFAIFSLPALGQRIIYSEADDDDSRRMRFEIIGKISGNILVYKNTKNRDYISVYDNEMNQVARVEQDYIPDDDLINIDFFPYGDFTYLVYQYQKKRVVYCDAVKIDGNGKKVSNVITLDTAHIGFSNNNKVYTAISSEDKSKLVLFKINSKNKSKYLITTLLFDNTLNPLKTSTFNLAMNEEDDYLDEFHVDNDGDLVFVKVSRNNNETIRETSLFYKQAQSDSLVTVSTQPEKILLDEIHLKVDNLNKRFFLTSFYYTKKRGDIEGFYFYVWDKASKAPVLQNSLVLAEDLRREAKGSNANTKTAFNDYFIRNVVIKRDGGFVINSESYYTVSRGTPWNRWNYLYGYPSTYDYYNVYSPYYSSWYWRDRYNNRQNVRFNADNITILSFDKTGKLEWSNVIHKEQFDDESEDKISYQTVNTGGQIHYVFNVDEKRGAELLNDFALSPDGQITRNPTLKNLDRGYEFMPKYGKQVSSYQLVVPCYFHNNICFAKVEFNQ